MSLLQLQRRMMADIMKPLTKSDTRAGAIHSGYIKRNNLLTARARLEIYRRSYWYRLTDSLYEDYPGLRAVLGQRAFHRTVQAYLADCPSRSFTLRNLGSRLEAWLRRNPAFAGSNAALAQDMAKLEWAHIQAWDSGQVQPLARKDLRALGPATRIGLQPHIQLIALQYPVDEFRLSLRSPDGPVKIRKAAARFVAVHRLESGVFYKTLAREEFRLLRCLNHGRTIAEALNDSLPASLGGPEEIQSRLSLWFQTWAQLGWLVPVSESGK